MILPGSPSTAKFAASTAQPDTQQSAIDELQKENKQLRELVVQLTKIILKNVVDQK